MDTLVLNVSGRQFKVGKSTLMRYPSTKLGRLSQSNSKDEEQYFDRNPKLMLSILDLYRTGQLHLPNSMCSLAIRAELDFWDIDEALISECCWKRYSAETDDVKAVDALEKAMSCYQISEQTQNMDLREKLWMTMEYPKYSGFSKVWFCLYIVVVIVIVATSCISISPEMRVPKHTESRLTNESTLWDMLLDTEISFECYVIELVCLIFFTIESFVRFLVCPSKVDFLKESLNVMDMMLNLTMWTSVILDHIPSIEHARAAHTVLRALFCLNILRIFHIGRSSHGVKLLVFTLTDSLQAFGLLLISLTMAVIILATAGYFAEVIARADTFDNIAIAIWWVIITMTTVGYGDYSPHTWPGYCVGIICAVAGILLLAMPIAIIASNFNKYYSNISSAQQRIKRKHILKDKAA